MHRHSPLIAVVLLGWLAAHPLAQAAPPEPPRPPSDERVRRAEALESQIRKLERSRDQLIDKKGLKDDDPRIRELDEHLERMHHELESVGDAGRPDDRERDRRSERLERELQKLERRRDGLVDRKGKKEDDPEVRELSEQIERIHHELGELEGDHERPRPHEIGLGGPRPPAPELREKLGEQIGEVEFDDVAFGEALDFLRELNGLNINVHWPALAEVDVDAETPVELERLLDVPLETILRLMLRNLTESDAEKIVYFADGNVVVITTPDHMPRPGPPVHVDALLERLRHERPELHDRLIDMSREHPEQFRREVAELIRAHPRRHGMEREHEEEVEEREREELRREHPEQYELMKRDEELTDRTLELAERVRQAKGPEEREKIHNQLRELLSQQFDLRMEMRKLEVKQLRRELEALNRGIASRMKNKDDLLRRRIKELLNPEETEW